ncbi:hypothetical protein PF005_g16886 [Phytophthora fragariae]|nr:hypothetical protein PF003_g2209 [Phytophthora fragariae]KAE8995065.1 hypothetical protein PF011_g16491 [Phytophthora fragariae]KAE9096170.1 hypothetical protein PF007_g17109 [Phytophthora fragariae]KAE9196424.1 hypothetical protein PF005_g16886 [Phytophthora fragariae]
MSDVFRCDQVLNYRPATSIALVDDIDLPQEPDCRYIYMVATRGYSGEHHQVVTIPLVDARSQAISRDEFVMGFYHAPLDAAADQIRHRLAVVQHLAARQPCVGSANILHKLSQTLGRKPRWIWVLKRLRM